MATNIEREIEQIRHALTLLGRGATIDELIDVSGLHINRRTVQRRLQQMQAEGKLRIEGRSRSTLYFLADETLNTKPATTVQIASDIPVSKEGLEIQALLSRPISSRPRVGYNAAFLHSYQPNVTNYLSQEELNRLTAMGQLNNYVEPAGTYTRDLLQRLLIDLSWNSSRLEGNTYSLLDTHRLIAHGDPAAGQSTLETQMIVNHKEAIEFISDATGDTGFNRYTLLSLHALLSDNLLPDPAASGRLRTMAVGIGNSVYTPLAVPQQIEELFELFLQKAAEIINPFEQAFFVMTQLPYLQPFDDVNKRVSRIAVNIPFIREHLSPLSFIDVPNDLYTQAILGIYELNRTELLRDLFMWAYGRSAARYASVRQILGEPDPFRIKYREQIRNLISRIVTRLLNASEADEMVKEVAQQLPAGDQIRFIEVAETELLSLHEGNFARYRIRPSEYKAWSEVWKTRM